jgi:HlyD family secretion protein
MEDSKMKPRNLLYLLIAPALFLSCSRNNLSPGGSGLIEATEVTFSAEAAGQLKKLNFDEGDKIGLGDTIGMIDTITTALRLSEAESALEVARTRVQTTAIAIDQADYNMGLAKKDYDRISSLLKTGSANQQQFDQAENAFNQATLAKKQAVAAYNSAQSDVVRAESGIALLRKQLNDCHPLSPVTGTVINKYVEVGELIGIGKQILKIAKLDTVWVKIYLPPADLARIKLGSPAKVDPENGQKRLLYGNVSWISDAAEFTPKNVQTKEARADLVYATKIIIPNAEGILKIGMPVSVEIR